MGRGFLQTSNSGCSSGDRSSGAALTLSRAAVSFLALAVALGVSVKSLVALPLTHSMRALGIPSPLIQRVASQSEADSIHVRFAMPDQGSIRDQYLNKSILLLLLRDRASSQPAVRQCQLKVQTSDQFPNLDLTVSHPSPAQRVDCLRGATRYILQEAISEADFLAARETEADATRRWREPHPRYSGLAEGATERLAYLAIYRKYSPLYEIQSVGVNDIMGVSFDAFSLWLRRNRDEKLITFHAKKSLLELIGLPAHDRMILMPSVSLSSPRVPPGVLLFDGERFGIPALIMVSLDTDNAGAARRINQSIRDRFACNRYERARSRLEEEAATGAISSISCFSHWVFGDTWLGLAVRKSDGSEYGDFCRQVRALAADTDVATLVRETPEISRGLYVLLPSKCETQK